MAHYEASAKYLRSGRARGVKRYEVNKSQGLGWWIVEVLQDQPTRRISAVVWRETEFEARALCAQMNSELKEAAMS